MSEHHQYRIRPYAGQARCANGGCPAPAAFEARYRFQHDGARAPTERSWRYCARHARGWAEAHSLAFPAAPPREPPRPSPPADDEAEPDPRARTRVWSRRLRPRAL